MCEAQETRDTYTAAVVHSEADGISRDQDFGTENREGEGRSLDLTMTMHAVILA